MSSQVSLETWGLASNSEDTPNYILFLCRYTLRARWFIYFFAGGVENIILQLLFSKLGYECQLMRNAKGIALYSDEPLDFSLIPNDANKIKEIIHGHWQSFLPSVSVGPFFNLLPISLKRKEVLSQVDYGDTISNAIVMRNTSVIPISGRPFWDKGGSNFI